MSVLGIDVGTTNCKGVVLTSTGKMIAQATRRYKHDAESIDDRCELPAEDFRDGVLSLIKTLAEQSNGVSPITAVSLSTHGETLIPIDANGNALSRAILSMDRRSVSDANELEKRLGAKRFYEITGAPIHSMFPIAKLMWMKREQPELFSRASGFVSTQDYLNGILGAKGFVDYSLASRFGGLDIRRRSWSDAIFDAAELSTQKLSLPVNAGTVIGEMPKALRDALGMKEKVKIVAGGHDQPCASLAMGARDGRITVSAGSYESAAITTASPLNDDNGFRGGMNSYCHVLKDRYVTLGFFASGLIVQWFIDKFCKYESACAKGDVHELLESMMPERPSGICFIPHVFGSMNPEWNEQATAAFAGLRSTDGVGEMYKAVLEGLSCELDLNLRMLEKMANQCCDVVISGGGAASDRWMRMRTEICSRPISRLKDSADASCIGAAMLAAFGNGEPIQMNDIDSETFMPENGAFYASQKAHFLALHGHSLAEVLK